MTPTLTIVLRIETEMQECVEVRIRLDDDVAAATAVAAARSAPGNIFLAAKRKTTVTAVAGFHADPNFINEHDW
jgi:hypothetical protein